MQRFLKFSRRKRASSPRRGQMLLMFFFFLLAFLPLMALIVDLSLVRLARREMQTAVNAAALEGLRGQGLIDSQGQGLISSEEQRRMNARNLLRAVPRSSDDESFWNWPDLELNLDNMAGGDMATGQYSAGSRHREGTYKSNTDYPFDREDFEYSVDEKVVDAFLVRRRSTHLPETLPGVSSRGRAVPLVFGQIWAPPIPGIRENGVTVRAAAIAAARPAMMVGPPLGYPDPTTVMLPNPTTLIRYIAGAAPFAIEFFDAAEDLDEPSGEPLGWTNLKEGDWYDLKESDANGDGNEVSRWVLVHSVDSEEEIPVMPIVVSGSLAFGSPVAEDTVEDPDELLDSEREYYYLPIFRTFTMTDLDPLSIRLVVGFGGIFVRRGEDGEKQVSRRRFIAPENASATARNNISSELRSFLNPNDFPNLSSEQRDTIIRELLEEVWRQQPIQDGLLAPALVRAMD